MATIHFPSPGWLVLFACFSNLGQAFMDVVCDGLMVINARKDPKAGSEELQTYSWIMYGAGGIFGSLMSGSFLTGTDEVTGEPNGNPYILFGIMAVFAGALGITGLFIDKSLEEN